MHSSSTYCIRSTCAGNVIAVLIIDTVVARLSVSSWFVWYGEEGQKNYFRAGNSQRGGGKSCFLFSFSIHAVRVVERARYVPIVRSVSDVPLTFLANYWRTCSRRKSHPYSSLLSLHGDSSRICQGTSSAPRNSVVSHCWGKVEMLGPKVPWKKS